MNWNPVARWANGLIGGFIGGGSSGVISGWTASMLAPDKFNTGEQRDALLMLMGTTFVVSGIVSALLFLKQHPLPDWDGIDRRNDL